MDEPMDTTRELLHAQTPTEIASVYVRRVGELERENARLREEDGTLAPPGVCHVCGARVSPTETWAALAVPGEGRRGLLCFYCWDEVGAVLARLHRRSAGAPWHARTR